jgi:uncharacterized membrane protein YedE/YeeE
MAQLLVSFAAGVLFALGLGLAGMMEPLRIRDFLDFAGDWDPSMMGTMGAAVAVNAAVWWWLKSRGRPLLAEVLQVPTRQDIDHKLILGSTIFGAGWGLVGYCPGPAIASVSASSGPVLLFVGTMLLGMWLHEKVRSRLFG